MKSLLRALPVLAMTAAACESVAIRLALPNRPTEGRLYLEAFGLWMGFGVLALVPAAVACAFLARRRAARAAARGAASTSPALPPHVPALVLAAAMGLPVLAHAVLDPHIGLAGDLSALGHPRPWFELALVLALAAVALWGVARLLQRIPLGRVALALALASLVSGFLLPWRRAPVAARTSAGDRPNVLLLIWDTVRADHTSPYGYERDTTPHLAALARDARVFDEARSVSCFTFTSHLSMLTGRTPSEHGARLLFTRYRIDRAPHVARAFQEAGYRTGGFVGTDVLAGRTGIRYGFEIYDDQVDPAVCDTQAWSLVHDVQAALARFVPSLRNNGRPHWIQDFQRPGAEVLDHALEWIRRDDPRPWFCMINLYDAHWPYLPDAEGRERFVAPYDGPLDGFLFRSNRWKKGTALGERDRAHMAELYDAELWDLDRAVDGFLGALALERGGTAVVMTSDHGEAFGEGGEWMHDDVLEPQVHVPLLVRSAEARPTGARFGSYASGIDVAPTLLGLAGLDDALARFAAPGLNLAAVAPDPEREILVEDRDHDRPDDVNVALYRGPWKLMRRGLGDEAQFFLYDLRADPVGEHDVAAEEPAVFADMRARLLERRAQADREDQELPPEMGGSLFDALDGLGYTGR